MQRAGDLQQIGSSDLQVEIVFGEDLRHLCEGGKDLAETVELTWKKHIYICVCVCETWMKLCQARCKENKRKVPESPLLTARRGGLTVYATPWSQKRGRHFGSLSFFRQYCGPVFGAGFWPHFWDHERANRSCSTVLTARISSICWRQPSFCNASRHGHTHTSI